MSPVNLPQQIEKLLKQSLIAQDSQVQVRIRRNSFGWFRLYIVTSIFEQKDFEERKLKVNAIIATLNLNLDDYPFSNYQLLTPLEAAEEAQISPVQVPLWSEILFAPDPEIEFVANEMSDRNDKDGKTFVVTFYSFKGGVGRSTALAFVANILAVQGYRIVMIDFDLEAPGLSFAHPVDVPEATTYGVLDYVHQRYLTPEENIPAIDECIRQISISARGELYLIPAGAYDEDYIHRLADLNIHSLYQSKANPIHQLLEDVKKSLKPDIILIDARTGFTDMGAVALFDQADLGIICFSPTKQSYAGLEWVVKAASKQRKYNGIPDLRFLLTPMPPVASIQQQEWLGQAADWITKYWDIPPGVTVDELYYYVPYNSNIMTLESLFENVPTAILDSYLPVADVISASLPEQNPIIFANADVKISEDRKEILDELRFRSPTAQEVDVTEIPTIFQRTGDFPKFLQDRTWLVRGAKGAGKTLLFRLFIEQPDTARILAKPYEDLQNVGFVSGHGPLNLHRTFLTSGSLEDYEKLAGRQNWAQFWPHYLLFRLAAERKDLQPLFSDPFLLHVCKHEDVSHKEILAWLVSRIGMSFSSSRVHDELHGINEWLKGQNQKIWILYDELDTGFGRTGFEEEYDRRRSALGALLEWWLEVGPGLSNFSPKILLREDIWAGLNFTNKTYYTTRTVLLRWEEEDLWRLVLRQILNTSPKLVRLIEQQASIELELSRLDTLQLGILRKSLFPLWSERMGRTNKAYTYNWVRKRIGDYRENRFPRSLIMLLQEAVEKEKMAYDRNPYEVVLRPRSLIETLPGVSKQRVDEVCDEYPEFEAYLKKLVNERSPISIESLKLLWEQDVNKLKAIIAGMVEAGILQSYLPRPQAQNMGIQRYSIAELYLSGLGMTRLGQR